MKTIIKIILLLIIINASLPAFGQEGPLVSLQSELQRLSETYNITISYSPTMIAKYNVHRIKKKDINSDLSTLLNNTDLYFERVNNSNYFISQKAKDYNLVNHPTITQPAEIKHKIPITIPLHPNIAIKSNLLYDLSFSISLGMEFALSKRWSADISGLLNLGDISWSNEKLKNISIQPEIRYWTCQTFQGGFFAFNAHYSKFNVGHLNTLIFSDNMYNNRYEGYLNGIGIAYGYSWILSNRWSLEGEFGLGYSRIHYRKYPCTNCGTLIKSNNKNYLGPTKAALNLVYMLK